MDVEYKTKYWLLHSASKYKVGGSWYWGINYAVVLGSEAMEVSVYNNNNPWKSGPVLKDYKVYLAANVDGALLTNGAKSWAYWDYVFGWPVNSGAVMEITSDSWPIKVGQKFRITWKVGDHSGVLKRSTGSWPNNFWFDGNGIVGDEFSFAAFLPSDSKAQDAQNDPFLARLEAMRNIPDPRA